MKNYHIVKGTIENLEGWILKEEGANKHSLFATTKAGCIAEASRLLNFLGKPASVKIHMEDGTIEEERTYPRAADPVKSKG